MSSTQMQALRRAVRSDILVHWTGGKHIELDFRNGEIDPQTKRDKYIDTLYNALIKQKKFLFFIPFTPSVEEELKNDDIPSSNLFPEIAGQYAIDSCHLLKIRDDRWLIKKNGYTKLILQRENELLNVYTYIQGLWMNWQEIECIPKGRKLRNNSWPATSFTELKLSDVYEHADHYGHLGFGFSRKFVMERYGAPVHYVRGAKECSIAAQDCISDNLFKVLKVLEFLEKKTTRQKDRSFNLASMDPQDFPEFISFLEKAGLESFLSEERQKMGPLLYDPEDGGVYGIFARLRASISSCAIFVKRMSEKMHREFELLDESEWRIPYIHRMEDERKIWIIYGYRQLSEPEFRPACVIPFNQRDLKLLIFPDDKTRIQALGGKSQKSQDIADWLFRNHTEVPIIVTVEECLQF